PAPAGLSASRADGRGARPPLPKLLSEPETRGRGIGTRRADRATPDPLRPALRRPAATTVHRAGPRRASPGRDPRRAHDRARPARAAADVGGDPAAPRREGHGPAGDTRDGGGGTALRPGRSPRRRPARPGRHARRDGGAGGSRQPRRRVRRPHRESGGGGGMTAIVARRPGLGAWLTMIQCEIKMVVRDTAGLVVPIGLPLLILVMSASTAAEQVVINGRTV